jgi:predicted phosphodiesterase
MHASSRIADAVKVALSNHRIVILSDTHLGRPGCAARSADALRPLWAGAGELIINGDLAEVHDADYRVPAARAVMRLIDLCEDDAVHLCLLSGNHDPFLSDRRYLRLFGGEVFVTHGDILHPAISPWTDHANRLKQLHADALASLEPAAQQQLEDRLGAAQFASVAKWEEFTSHPTRRPLQRKYDLALKVARVLWYWHTLPRLASDFAQKYVPQSRFFVFGHIHRAGIWHLGGRVIINTGSYDFPARPRAVVIEHGYLSVWPIIRKGDVFAYGPRPFGRYPLSQFAVDAGVPTASGASAA